MESMNQPPTTVIVILVLFLTGIPLHARIIHVPDDNPSIQSGIRAAEDGDTVMVSPGIYEEYGLDFEGRKITVMSTDPDNPNVVRITIIDANSRGRVFNFHSGEDSTSVVSGFTMMGGYTSSWGGAIRCLSTSPKITRNIIRDSATEHGGGGIYLEESNAIVRDNTIMGNTAGWGGGGIRCSNSDPFITGNTIIGNLSDYGGGIDCHYNSDPIVAYNIILGNSAGDGGGIYCYDYSSPVLIYNLVAENSAVFGGGMHCRYDTNPLLINNSFVDNIGSVQGGGVRCMYSAPVNVINSIFWGNQAPAGKEFYMGGPPSANPSRLTISYSDVEGGINSVYHEQGNDVEWGDGMIDEDPLFVYSDKDDYRLLWGSPCIDSGHPDSFDLDGTRRDIGAHYYDQNQYLTLYLTPDTSFVNQGGELGVTYTLINRWNDPVLFDIETEVLLPNGTPYNLINLEGITLPSDYTEQVSVFHGVPMVAPIGTYTYLSRALFSIDSIYGEDRFLFEIVE